MKITTVRGHITHLRAQGYVILCETTPEAGDPRYRLIAQPGEPIT